MTPLQVARQVLMDARARAEHSPSAENLQALEEARDHLDMLLDTRLESPPSPAGSGAESPEPAVSEDEWLPGVEIRFNA